jgi:enamine deaminase RidA (YjgF/YER057c/UK114 family)
VPRRFDDSLHAGRAEHNLAGRMPYPRRLASALTARVEPGRLRDLCQAAAMTTPSPVRLVRSPQLSDQAPYAYAAVAERGSRWVFTAGACPLDEHGAIVAPGDVAAQTEQVMTNLRIALADAGAALRDVVKTTVYVASARREDLVATWEVVHRHFGDHDAPSTLLGVAVLGYRDQLVEVEAIAALA